VLMTSPSSGSIHVVSMCCTSIPGTVKADKQRIQILLTVRTILARYKQAVLALDSLRYMAQDQRSPDGNDRLQTAKHTVQSLKVKEARVFCEAIHGSHGAETCGIHQNLRVLCPL
jgi:hypothetical protein